MKPGQSTCPTHWSTTRPKLLTRCGEPRPRDVVVAIPMRIVWQTDAAEEYSGWSKGSVTAQWDFDCRSEPSQSEPVTYNNKLHSGRTSIFDRRTFPVPRSTCSWRVTTYVGKPSAIGQPTRPTQPFIISGSINWVVIYFIVCVLAAPSGECSRS